MKATLGTANLERGEYPALFDGIQEKTSREGNDYWLWDFTARKTTGELVPVSGATSTKVGPRAKSYRWFTGLLGHKPNGETVDTDGLIGTSCRIQVEENEAGYPNVVEVLPTRLSAKTIAHYADQADAEPDGLGF
jgi:hypothetical protein